MTKRKLKPFVLPALYSFTLIALTVSVYYIQSVVQKSLSSDESLKKLEYVDSEIVDPVNVVPVISNSTEIIRPYLSKNVQIGKNYYDYKEDATKQEQSLILYQNTYMQNSGVDYTSPESFDVVSILDGVVMDVKNDDTLGTTIEIRHDGELISIYQSLKEVDVKKDDKISQGQIIGQSGSNNISPELKEHLHFELYSKGQVVNPENYFGKKIEDL